MTRKLTYASLMQAAQDNWPEDEAYSILCDARDMDEPISFFADTIRRLKTQFSAEPDGQDLIARFNARLVAGL